MANRRGILMVVINSVESNVRRQQLFGLRYYQSTVTGDARVEAEGRGTNAVLRGNRPDAV